MAREPYMYHPKMRRFECLRRTEFNIQYEEKHAFLGCCTGLFGHRMPLFHIATATQICHTSVDTLTSLYSLNRLPYKRFKMGHYSLQLTLGPCYPPLAIQSQYLPAFHQLLTFLQSTVRYGFTRAETGGAGAALVGSYSAFV